jgi:hypothetical protein
MDLEGDEILRGEVIAALETEAVATLIAEGRHYSVTASSPQHHRPEIPFNSLLRSSSEVTTCNEDRRRAGGWRTDDAPVGLAWRGATSG